MPNITNMTRRVVSLLLVPLVLASQGLCLAHTHLGTQAPAASGHAARPHFHVHDSGDHHQHHAGHGHHHDGADDPEDELPVTSVAPIDDHDADAVYCPEAVVLSTGRHAKANLAAKLFGAAPVVWMDHTLVVATLRLAHRWSQPPPFRDSHCPIYLRTLSLRL